MPRSRYSSSITWRPRLQTDITTPPSSPSAALIGPAAALRLFKTAALDIVTGFGIFMLALVTALGMHNIHNPAFFLLAVSALLFAAALIRQALADLNPWLHGLLISLGASIPVVLLGKAFVALTLGPMELAILIVPAFVCGCGAQAWSLWNRHHRTLAFGLGLVLLLGLVAGDKELAPRILAASASKPINKASPPFTLTMLDGSEVSLASLKGHVVVLDFWGTWCAPCLAEMPVYDTVYNRFKGNPDVTFLLVNSGLNGDTSDKVRRFTQTRHLQIPVALDTTHAAQAIGANLLPTLVILDKNGKIRLENSGFEGPDKLLKKLTEEIQLLLASG